MDQLYKHIPFDREYFEFGAVTGVSGYTNYRWMPELTLRMAHHLVRQLPIEAGQSILDFGCAKGYLVKALRIFDFEAYGADISPYAIDNCDGEVRGFCRRIDGVGDPALFPRRYDWIVAKDVLEHVDEDDLRQFLSRAARHADNLFVVVPLAADDHSGRYIVPDYDNDATHVIAKSLDWWAGMLEGCGWRVDLKATGIAGCKENWRLRWPDGNGFFRARSAMG
jgi:SAM-dependent methyltransferase